jgi:hypothetical protein
MTVTLRYPYAAEPATDDDGAVGLIVPRSTRPWLALQSDRGGWVRLHAEGTTVAWARQGPALQWMAFWRVRRAGLQSIDPIPTRALGARSWPGFFARALAASSRTPLTEGHYELGWVPPRSAALRAPDRPRATDLDRALDLPDAMAIPLAAHGTSVLALRSASAPDAARVKSWRKQAAAGALPPILLWWVSALDRYVIVDGHDRLKAALLEGVKPQAVALYAVHQRTYPDVAEGALERYAEVMTHEAKLSNASALEANRRLLHGIIPFRDHPSRARHRRGLRALFEEEVERGQVELPAAVRAIFLA